MLQKEFMINGSFAFTVEALDASRILGCVCVRALRCTHQQGADAGATRVLQLLPPA